MTPTNLMIAVTGLILSTALPTAASAQTKYFMRQGLVTPAAAPSASPQPVVACSTTVGRSWGTYSVKPSRPAGSVQLPDPDVRTAINDLCVAAAKADPEIKGCVATYASGTRTWSVKAVPGEVYVYTQPNSATAATICTRS